MPIWAQFIHFVFSLDQASVDFRALLISGSRGFSNYRHQADVCHQYNLFTSAISATDVTLMMYDDVAWSERNPLLGRLFNYPNGENVYEGCVTDYRKEHVSLENFVFETNRLANLTSENTVTFISFVDHGQPGYLLLPNGEQLDGETFVSNLFPLSDASTTSITLVYVEACHAGSLFEGKVLPPRTLVVTAANATESSWAAFCPSPSHPLADYINGVHIGACLGDLFSVAWVNDIENRLHRKSNASLGDHIESVREIVATKSNVMVYGDVSLLNMKLLDIFPPLKEGYGAHESVDESFMIDSSQPQKSSEIFNFIPESVNTEIIM